MRQFFLIQYDGTITFQLINNYGTAGEKTGLYLSNLLYYFDLFTTFLFEKNVKKKLELSVNTRGV